MEEVRKFEAEYPEYIDEVIESNILEFPEINYHEGMKEHEKIEILRVMHQKYETTFTHENVVENIKWRSEDLMNHRMDPVVAKELGIRGNERDTNLSYREFRLIKETFIQFDFERSNMIMASTPAALMICSVARRFFL